MKKLLAITLTLCLAVCAALALSACTMKVSGKSFVYDSWESSVELSEAEKAYVEQNILGEMSSVKITFNSDGTFAIVLIESGETVETGNYAQDGEKITFEGMEQAFGNCGVKGDKIYASMTEGSATITIYFKQA